MQTFDAAGLTLKPNDDLEIYYAYVSKVNRIFGSDVFAPIHTDFEGNSHLIHFRYKDFPLGTLTLYSYLLDLGNKLGDINSNQSFGFSLAGDLFDSDYDYHLEYAFQTDAFDSPLDYETHYGHGFLSGPLNCGFTGTLGLEYLGSDNNVGYKFPLGTNHKFNGFADRFLNTPPTGLTDLYASVGKKLPCDFGARAFYHHFLGRRF